MDKKQTKRKHTHFKTKKKMSQVLHQFYAGLITAVDVTVSLCLRMKDGDGRYEWRQYERLTQS